MNINIPPLPPRRTARRSFSALLAATLAIASTAPAADWYLNKNQPMGSSWNTLADWKPAADGSGASPGSLSAADTYRTNNYSLRTPETNTTTTFPGGTLWLEGGNGFIAVKTYSATGLAVIPRLVSTGGKIQNSSGGLQYVQVGHYENRSGSTTLATQAGRSLKLTVGTLVGSGELRFSGNACFLEVAHAMTYTGDICLAAGTLDFDNDLSSAGRLRIDAGTQVALDQSVTFTGLVVAGTAYPVGTYTYAALQAAHPAIFTSGTSGGAIVVRAPRNWYLSTHQPIGASWDTLAHWRANPDGTGATADSVNAHDNYINQTSGRSLRTPETTATFGGGSLVLDSGANLILKAPAGHVSTIPAFETSGAVSITNGFGNITQTLVVDDWHIASGTTSLSVPGTNTVVATIDALSGPGTLQTGNGGKYTLNIRGAQGFTGTLHHNSGTLTLGSQIGTRGAFVVDSAAAVKLNMPGFFTGATIAGASLAPGYHSYASLHAAYPARFPAGASSAFLAIYPPDTTGPATMFGVNLAGADSFAKASFPGTYGYQWIYPNAAEFDYYHSKGLNLIRIPFRWERMQPVRGGALDPAELARMDTVVGYAAARGMKVILDMHNYARWVPPGSNQTPVLIGTGSVTLAHFGDVWRRLADHYKGNTAIYGYGIMNEPYSTGGTWPAIAQTAVDAIRTVDLTTCVIVGGDTWSNARGWRSKNPNLDIQDPVGRLLYEAHCYFDGDNSGTYAKTYDAENAYPMLGVDRVKEFVEWLQERGAKGFIGEYGVPRNDARWLPVLDNFLAYLQANGVSGTYWAGGPWWGDYHLTCEPTNNFTVDRPQMSVLEDYN